MSWAPRTPVDIDVAPELPDMYAEPMPVVVVAYGDQKIEALGEDQTIIATRVP
jgi:hypothetical protein